MQRRISQEYTQGVCTDQRVCRVWKVFALLPVDLGLIFHLHLHSQVSLLSKSQEQPCAMPAHHHLQRKRQIVHLAISIDQFYRLVNKG